MRSQTFAAHLSGPFAARARLRGSVSWVSSRSFRPGGSPPLDEDLAASTDFGQGCQVAARSLGMHISEMGSCPTVRSNDMKPRSISSEER